MHIRHLPAKCDMLIDTSMFPKNMVMYNPSASGDYISIRVTVSEHNVQMNKIALYSKVQKTLSIIDSPLHLLHPSCNLYKGLEDVRIVCYNDFIWFTASSTHATERMTNELVLGRFDKNANKVEKIWVIDVGILPVKNVVLFVDKDVLFLLDVFQKKIFALDYDNDSDTYTARQVHMLEGMEGDFKGSTSPVHIHGNTWGCVIHTDVRNEEPTHFNRLSYMHYWMEFDLARGAVTFISSAFWCASWMFEYISGIEYDKTSHQVTLYGGIQDTTPLTVTTYLSKLRNSK